MQPAQNFSALQTGSSALLNFRKALRTAWKMFNPPRQLRLSEWAQEYRVLSPESGNRTGPWKNEKVPYLVGIMDAMTSPEVETVSFMKSARTGGTEAINNFVGYIIHMDPGPILMVRPTLVAAQKWSKVNLESMLRDTAPLKSSVFKAGYKVKSKRETLLMKHFPGGIMYVVGANSPVGLSDTTIRYLLLDEIDRFPPSVGGDDGEGDPISLAEKRTLTFWNRKIVIVSTPTTKGASRIEESFLASNMQFFYVPCTKCGVPQVLVFSHRSQLIEHFVAVGRGNDVRGKLIFDKDNVTWAYYECGSCQSKLDESDKIRMVPAGTWSALRPERIKHAGFHISELYSMLGSTWRRIAEDFVKAGKRREKLRPFTNLTLGETFEENISQPVSGHELMHRREGYTHVPAGVVFLTATVDVQDNRFEVLIKGWGLDEESWFIKRFEVHGSPGQVTTQKMLLGHLLEPVEHGNGYKAKFGSIGGIIGVGIDTGGHHTQAMYQFVRRQKQNRFFALKGRGGQGLPIISRISRRKNAAVDLYIIGTDSAKQRIMDRLRSDLNRDDDGRIHPTPGGLHFNESCDEEYFAQLTSERQVWRRTRGIPRLVWEKIDQNKPNEALDLEVYALAVYLLLNAPMQRFKRLLDRVFERHQLNHPVSDVQDRPEDGIVEASKPVHRKPIRRRPRGGWMSGF